MVDLDEGKFARHSRLYTLCNIVWVKRITKTKLERTLKEVKSFFYKRGWVKDSFLVESFGEQNHLDKIWKSHFLMLDNKDLGNFHVMLDWILGLTILILIGKEMVMCSGSTESLGMCIQCQWTLYKSKMTIDINIWKL